MGDSFLTKHLRDAGETYFGHLGFTIRAGSLMVLIAVVVVIHGLFPFIMTHTGSDLLAGLQRQMAARKKKCRERGGCAASPADHDWCI